MALRVSELGGCVKRNLGTQRAEQEIGNRYPVRCAWDPQATLGSPALPHQNHPLRIREAPHRYPAEVQPRRKCISTV